MAGHNCTGNINIYFTCQFKGRYPPKGFIRCGIDAETDKCEMSSYEKSQIK